MAQCKEWILVSLTGMIPWKTVLHQTATKMNNPASIFPVYKVEKLLSLRLLKEERVQRQQPLEALVEFQFKGEEAYWRAHAGKVIFPQQSAVE